MFFAIKQRPFSSRMFFSSFSSPDGWDGFLRSELPPFWQWLTRSFDFSVFRCFLVLAQINRNVACIIIPGNCSEAFLIRIVLLHRFFFFSGSSAALFVPFPHGYQSGLPTVLYTLFCAGFRCVS